MRFTSCAMFIVLLSLCTVRAEAQTALETYAFISFGDVKEECGRGLLGFGNILKCEKKTNSDTITIITTQKASTGKLFEEKIEYIMIDECRYRTVLTTKIHDSNFEEELIRIDDLSRVREYEIGSITPPLAQEIPNITYIRALIVGGTRVSNIITKKSDVIDAKEDGGNKESILIRPQILGESADKARERWLSAVAYFRRSFCKGRAF